MTRHNCPDCECEPVCALCRGSGLVVDVRVNEHSTSYGTKRCPRGCAAPHQYIAFIRSPSATIVDARAHSTRTFNL